ncbi:DUF488 family protein [Streptomyces sp. NPDC006514]|uniref:DUF488 family protein, N3 subclade n=1 Tax=Streptomyces sp. NPDC006514 TaxID=3154308 RepID=UPI0033A3B4F1
MCSTGRTTASAWASATASPLAPEHAERYTREILDPFDLGALAAELPHGAVSALFCVERDPEACHRSLVAERLRAEHGLPVMHIRPG